jgi:hypothetical protein
MGEICGSISTVAIVLDLLFIFAVYFNENGQVLA